MTITLKNQAEIEKIKAALGTADESNTSDLQTHNLSERFPFH